MNKEQLLKAFEELFPNWAKKIVSAKKIGSKTLAIKFRISCVYEGVSCVDEVSRVFLYYGPDNWQFGTKLWRRRAEQTPKKVKKEVKEDEVQLVSESK